jgi:hypothetical protein
MSDPKQPSFVPVVAGDLDEASTYTAPGEPYDGVLSLALPSAGTYSAGLEPDQSWFGAQSFNAIMQRYGQHIEAMADFPTFQVHVQAADEPGDRLDYAGVDGTSATRNNNGLLDPPTLWAAGDGYICTQLPHKNGHVGDAAIRRWSPASGKRIAGGPPDTGTDETAEWVESSDWPGKSPAESGKPVVLGFDRDTKRVISLSASREVQVSTDFGDNWSFVTDLTTNANWQYPTAVASFAGKWAVVDYCPTTTFVSRLLISNDMDASGAWTLVSGSPMGGNNGSECRRIIMNSTTLVMLPKHNTIFAWYEDGDAAITNVTIATADATRTGWRGAWNEQIGMFLVGNVQGDLWTSVDGKTWTQIANNMAGLSVRDIVAHGRGFVVANASGVQAIDFLDFDRKFAVRLRRLYTCRGTSNTTSGFHLINNQGRWYGARVTSHTITGSGGQAFFSLEWVYSDVNPFDRNSYVGR